MMEFRAGSGNAAREGPAPAPPARRTRPVSARVLHGSRQRGDPHECHRDAHVYGRDNHGVSEDLPLRPIEPTLRNVPRSQSRLAPTNSSTPAGAACSPSRSLSGAIAGELRCPRRLASEAARTLPAEARRGTATPACSPAGRRPCISQHDGIPDLVGSGTAGPLHRCRSTSESTEQRVIPRSSTLTLIVRNIRIVAEAAVVAIDRSSGSRNLVDCLGG
jgi:hypothetical protein